MAWEIESEHVDLDRMVHVTHFIEKSVKTIHGAEARHELQIHLRTEPTLNADGNPVGGEVIIHADGRLRNTAGNLYLHKAEQMKTLKSLNDAHSVARNFAKVHGVPIYAGPKR